jgi:hypothetical protein
VIEDLCGDVSVITPLDADKPGHLMSFLVSERTEGRLRLRELKQFLSRIAGR